jgi:MFS family permease
MTDTIRQATAGRFRGTLTPLNIHDFRLLISSDFLWWATRFMEMTVVGWLVLELTDSAWQVTVIGFYRSAPFLIVGFFSGPLIDRFGRRKVILWSQAANLLISAAIALLLWLDRLAFWHLAVSALLIGAAWSVDWPARRSFVPDLVGKAHTIEAMLLENLAQNIARIIGPFLGGALIAVISVTGAYSVLATISALALLILFGLSKRPIPRTQKIKTASPWAGTVEGWRYVRRNQPILGTLLITTIMNFLVFPYMFLLPVFARDVLHQGPTGLGILGAGAGVGAFIGLLLIGRLRRLISPGWIFGVGSLSQALIILIFSLSDNFSLSLLMLILSGIGQACFGTMQSAIMLLSASDEMRSRAMGTLVLAIGAGPLGQLQIGGLAEAFGAPLAVALHSTLGALSMVGIMVGLPGFRGKLSAGDEIQPPEQQARSDLGGTKSRL